MRGERISRLLFIILLLIYATIQCVGVGASETGTTLSVEPSTISVAPGGNFTVDIIVTNVTNLYSWNILIWFNPTILNATNLARGHFLEQPGYWTNWQLWELFHPGEPYGVINNTEGFLIVGDNFSPPLPPSGVNGSGTLATISFLAKAEGITLLSFDEEHTKLSEVIGTIKVPILHDRVDGVFDNREPPFLPPIALFDVEPSFANVNDTITFNASASHDPDAWLVSYEWDFGDGTTTTVTDPTITHAYNQSGIYTVSLTVTDYDNLTNTTTEDVAIIGINVEDHAVEVGGITFHVVTESNSTVSNFEFVQADKSISFNVTGPEDTVGYCNVTIPKNLLDAPPNQWTLLVDGKSETPFVTYNDTHTFLYLTYTLSTHNIEIIGATVATPPTASFTEDPLTPYVNELVTFNASASQDDDGEIISYKWDFGDQTPIVTETTPNTTHIYTLAGTYTVNLTVTDNDTLTNSVTETKTVLPIIEPQVKYNFTVEVEGEEFLITITTNSTVSEFTTSPEEKKISFTVNGTQGTTGFCNVTIPIRLLEPPYIVWFDDERKWDIHETENGTHVFLYFTYTLSTHTIDITGTTWGPTPEPPFADFSPSTTTPSVGDKVTFNASASYDPDGTIESWNWNFGDGTTDTGEIVNHTYTTAGNFTVTLTVTDDKDLNDTATAGIIVIAVPVHDIAITSVTVSSTEVEIGETVSITVVVENQGNFTENFQVKVYYDDTEIQTESITNLDPGDSKTLNITWETAEIDPNTYTIKAVAANVPNETKQDNNTYVDGTVKITEKEEGTAIPLHYLIAALAIAIILIVAAVVYFTKLR